MTTERITRAGTTAWRVAVAVAFLVCVVPGGVRGLHAGGSPTEREVKAAFIYNFAKFVEFPSGAFAGGDSPIIVGVFEDEQVADAIERLVKGKTASGRRLEVKRFSKPRQCDSCNVLFVGCSQSSHVSDVLEKVKNASILTIGESEGFARRGGIIGFVVESNKVGFEINAGTAKRNGLKISSKLLSLAKAVMG